VFVGEDEAAAAWDAHSIAAVRRLLPEVPTIVLKQGARGSVVLDRDGEHFVPALEVDVVEAVGAGDAFAAGFLAGMLRHQSPPRSARLGTLAASAALRTVADVAPLPEGLRVQELLEQDDTAWRQIGAFRDRR
jgi:2-dehydro-3-deoxygluconokinase